MSAMGGDPEALKVGQAMADKFRAAGAKKEEAAAMLAIATIHKEALEVDQALRAAQGALASYKASGSGEGRELIQLKSGSQRMQRNSSPL